MLPFPVITKGFPCHCAWHEPSDAWEFDVLRSTAIFSHIFFLGFSCSSGCCNVKLLKLISLYQENYFIFRIIFNGPSNITVLRNVEDYLILVSFNMNSITGHSSFRRKEWLNIFSIVFLGD